MFKELLKNSAILVTSLTAFFYLVGISFHQGYMSEFGITSKVFPLPFNEAILNGFATSIHILWSSKWYILYTIIGIFILIVLLTLIDEKIIRTEVIKDQKQQEKSNTHNESKKSNSFLNNIIVRIEWLGNLLYAFLIYMIIFVALIGGTIYISNNYGKKTASKFKSNFKSQIKNGDNENIKMIRFTWNGSEMKGAVISSSSNYLLIYTEKLKTVIINHSELKQLSIIN